MRIGRFPCPPSVGWNFPAARGRCARRWQSSTARCGSRTPAAPAWPAPARRCRPATDGAHAGTRQLRRWPRRRRRAAPIPRRCASRRGTAFREIRCLSLAGPSVAHRNQRPSAMLARHVHDVKTTEIACFSAGFGGNAQGGQTQFSSGFPAPGQSQSFAQCLTRVPVAPGADWTLDKAGRMVGKENVPGRQRSLLRQVFHIIAICHEIGGGREPNGSETHPVIHCLKTNPGCRGRPGYLARNEGIPGRPPVAPGPSRIAWLPRHRSEPSCRAGVV